LKFFKGDQIWLAINRFVDKKRSNEEQNFKSKEHLYAFLSVTNEVNVPSKGKKRKKNCICILEVTEKKEQDPEPDLLVSGADPLVRGADSDPRIRISD
jgi:hypothetical protein